MSQAGALEQARKSSAPSRWQSSRAPWRPSSSSRRAPSSPTPTTDPAQPYLTTASTASASNCCPRSVGCTSLGSTSPAAMAETHGHYARSWFEQAASNFMAIGVLALGAHEAALVPIQETLTANAARLGG